MFIEYLGLRPHGCVRLPTSRMIAPQGTWWISGRAATSVDQTLVGPVGLEPTTYGLKERPNPVGKVRDPPFRAWLVDAKTQLTRYCKGRGSAPALTTGSVV